MTIVEFFAGFLPLVVIGALGILALRLMRRARASDNAEPATLIRQAALYGLMYVTMVLTASGATWVYGEMVERSRQLGNSGLAEALALVALGLPAFTILLTVADRRLRTDPSERGFVWSLYLNAALLTTLIATMIGGYRLVRDTLDSSGTAQIDGSDVMLVMTWGAFWLVHWFFLLRRHGIRGDAHLAAGSIVGIVTLGIGNVGLFYALFDRLYTSVTDDALLDRSGPTTDEWAAVFAVGAVVWLWFWLSHFEDGIRTEAWYVTVVPVGSLLGFVALISAASTFGHTMLVWWIGDPSTGLAVRHFDQLPFVLAVALTGACAFGYHRWLLRTEATRNDPVRVYDYVLMAAALISASIGTIVLLGGLAHPGSVNTNDVLAGVTILAAGAPTWWVFQHRNERLAISDEAEAVSQVRRSYLYTITALAGLTMLSAGVSALEGVLEDVLDGRLRLDTIRDHRSAFAALAVASVVLWHHLGSLRSIRDLVVMPPPPDPRWPRRVIVLGGTIPDLEMQDHPNATVEYWHRTDRPDLPVIDVAQLSDALEHQPFDDVLVMVDDSGPMLIPFTR